MIRQSILFRQALWDRCVQQALWDWPVRQSLWDNMWVCSQFGPPILNIFSLVAVVHPVAGGGRQGWWRAERMKGKFAWGEGLQLKKGRDSICQSQNYASWWPCKQTMCELGLTLQIAFKSLWLPFTLWNINNCLLLKLQLNGFEMN